MLLVSDTGGYRVVNGVGTCSDSVMFYFLYPISQIHNSAILVMIVDKRSDTHSE